MNKHSKSVGYDCRKRAVKKWGLGWMLLSEEQQQGAIALEVVSAVLSSGDKSDVVVHLQAVAQTALYPTDKIPVLAAPQEQAA